MLRIIRISRGNQNQRNPRPGGEFRDEDYPDGDGGGSGAQSIQEYALPRPRAPDLFPVHHHARLGQGKGHEGTDGVERDEPIRHPAKNGQENGRQDGQGVNPFGEDQTAPSRSEDERQKAVEGDGTRKAWKVSERRIGGEREYDQDRNDARPIEPSLAYDRRQQLGQDALVARLAGHGGGDAVHAAPGTRSP